MYKSVSLIPVVLCLLLVCGDEASAAGAKTLPDVSLTLIPPSPVTDKITLDIRGAVWNRSNRRRNYRVNFYLDDESDKHLMHEKTVEIEAHSCRGIRFAWSTQGQSGRHRIILVATSDSQTLGVSRPLEIIASEVRSTGRIEGAWFEFYHWSEKEGLLWNSEIVKLTDAQWRELVRGMNDIGMNIIIIQDTYHNPDRYVGKHNMEKDGFSGRSYYPSAIYPKHPAIVAKDPLEAVLDQADKHGMYVMVGVGGYAWFDFTEGSLQWHKKVADELWNMYGHHPSFYGWYVSEEIAGNLGAGNLRRQQIVEFFREFKKHVTRLAPDKPVMLASNCHLVAQSGDYYPRLLKHLDILCPFGFHRMPPNDYSGEEVAAILQRYCDEADSHLWMDMEVFLFGNQGQLYPRPIDGVIDDLMRFPDFEKICCYSYTGLMNSPRQSCAPGGAATIRLYNDYRTFLAQGPPDYTVNHDAVGKKVELKSTPDPRYSKGNLADGETAPGSYRSEQWLGFENRDLHAVIDLGQTTSIETLRVGFLQNTTGAIVLPRQVEFCLSENGKDYHTVAILRHHVSAQESGSFIHLFEKNRIDRKARYVRLRAESVDQWLFVDEIIVNPAPKL